MTAYNLTRTNAYSFSVVASFASLEEALVHAREIALFIEEDEDNPGYYDLLTKGHCVMALVPA